jgi:colanic acid biosynthesis glycosyl transferase WcaI
VKKTVLIHTLIFPPDQVSTSYLYGDIAQKLIKSGYEVVVLTTYPHYNYEEDFKGKSKWGLFWRRTLYFGSRVYHFPQSKSESNIVRGIYILLFHIAFLFKAMTIKKFHYILTPSPPITSGFLSGIVAKLRGAKAIYNVQEIYPDVIIKQGGITNPILIKILKFIERYTYSLSEKVVTIDELFSKNIEERLDKKKLTCIPNFIDTDLYKPFEGKFSKDLDFNGKFIVGYAGNLGKVQDWDAILKVVESLQEEENIHFLIIGGGSEFDKLKSKEERFNNLSVWPYQMRERIPEINSRIDLHLIAMTKASDYDGLPSKVFAVLASGRPILAASNIDSPLSSILQKSGNGVIVELGNHDALGKMIIEISNGLLPKDSNSIGRQFVIDNYSKDVVTSKYVNLLIELG